MLNTSFAQLLCTPAYIFCVFIHYKATLSEITFAVPLTFDVLNIFTDSDRLSLRTSELH